MRGLLAFVLIVSGCDGVFGLRPVPDSALAPADAHPLFDTGVVDVTPNCDLLGHNEDGDTFPDECDNCPTVPNTGGDLDGDMVGNECDPKPGVGGDRIAFFSTCETLQNLASSGTVQTLGDAIRLTEGATLEAMLPPTPTAIHVRVQHGGNSGDAIQLAVGITSLTFMNKACPSASEPACLSIADTTGMSLQPLAVTQIDSIGVVGNKWFVEAGGLPFTIMLNTASAATVRIAAVAHTVDVKSVIIYTR